MMSTSTYDQAQANATPTSGLYQYLDDGSVNVNRSSESSLDAANDVDVRPSGRGTAVFDMVAIPDTFNRTTHQTSSNSELPFAQKKQKYKGRYRMWPGIVLLVLIGVLATAFVTYYAKKARDGMVDRNNERLPNYRRIQDGIDGNEPGEKDSEFDKPGNPKTYPDLKCSHINYITKNNFIYAQLPNGTEEKLPIKGINWSGMETSHGIPYGLWDNNENGTTMYQVASFLARHRFNSVRLPLSVENILKNGKIDLGFINQATNRAVNVTSYREVYKSIIAALAYRKISVLLDIHTLTPRDTGHLWYSDEISENDLLESVDILGKDLCNRKYWNIVGLDLKNEPAKGTWGGPKKTDWKSAAERIGNRMLKACSKWTAFVEGLAEIDTITIDGKMFTYTEWWGGGFQKAGNDPVILNTKDKVVWSPHYYSPAVYPAQYFFKGGQYQGPFIKNFVERSDSDLENVVNRTMHQMFGYLGYVHPGAIVLGEFGGLFATDKHPMKTTRRVISLIMKMIADKNNRYAGGYVWSLNPESGYEYNPVDAVGKFQEGLLDKDWLTANDEYLKSLKELDKMEGLQMFPCVPDDEN